MDVSEITQALRRQAEEAVEWVIEFAAALEAAADEDERAEVTLRYDQLRPRSGYVQYPLGAVVAAWDKGRRPDGYRNPYRPGDPHWWVAEKVLDRVGEPLTIEALNELRRSAPDVRRYPIRSKMTPSELVGLFATLANANLGKLAPAKTKVGTKVAYLLFETDVLPEPGYRGAGTWSQTWADRWPSPPVLTA